MRALFLESVAGIAGDMFAASFLDAKLIAAEEIERIPAKLGLDDVSIEISHPLRAALRTTHVEVRSHGESWKRSLNELAHDGLAPAMPHAHSHAGILGLRAPGQPHWHTHYRDIDRFLECSKLDAPAKGFARKVFRLIAEAEAGAHGVSLDEVAFHEVGTIDSIVDVAMAAHCVTTVGAPLIFATPLKLGRGLVQIEHGTYPVPPPASSRLTVGLPVAEVPGAITRENIELSTPTGIAILKALAPTFVAGVPGGLVLAQGVGSGTMDLGTYPNVFRVMLLEDVTQANKLGHGLPYESDTVIELVCNIDDETAERTAWVAERMLAQGALEVWTVPVIGKKGRAAVELHALSEPSRWQGHADWLVRKSSTFGLRHREWNRLKLARRFEKRPTRAGEVTYKVGLTADGEVLKEKPEFEDLRKLWDKDAGS